MTFRENLLKFLNEQKETISKELTEKFEKDKQEFEVNQQKLRETYLGGMDPNDYVKLMNDQKQTCLDKKREMEREYNRFTGKGGYRDKKTWNSRHPFSDNDLIRKIQSATEQAQNLIDYVESDYFEHSDSSYRSILRKYTLLEESTAKLNKIQELFPCYHDDY